MTAKKTRILFLCTGNSCRSQMAEGFARHLKSDSIDAWSAGIEQHGMNEHAIAVMAEKGVDISTHTSKLVEDLGDISFDYVITVCDNAHETCPLFAGNCIIIHAGFNDPPKMAKLFSNTEQQLDCYRQVRNEIEEYISALPYSLPGFKETK